MPLQLTRKGLILALCFGPLSGCTGSPEQSASPNVEPVPAVAAIDAPAPPRKPVARVLPPPPRRPRVVMTVSTPWVTANLSEDEARSKAAAGAPVVSERSQCFKPEEIAPSDGFRGSWVFVPRSGKLVENTRSCGDGQPNVGAYSLSKKAPDEICVAVEARPDRDGVSGCVTSVHAMIDIARPRSQDDQTPGQAARGPEPPRADPVRP